MIHSHNSHINAIVHLSCRFHSMFLRFFIELLALAGVFTAIFKYWRICDLFDHACFCVSLYRLYRFAEQ